MARDTERTRRLLLDAAADEFSQHGLAGARVDRIAAAAGVNKERIYQYFGKKDDLFARVVIDQLEQVMDEVVPEGEGVAAVGEYAGRVFDRQHADPRLGRLELWEGLELSAPVYAEERRASESAKVDRLRALVPGLSRDQAAELLVTIVTLSIGFPALHTFDALVTGRKPGTAARRKARRAVVVAAVEALAERMLAETDEKSG